MYIGKRGELVTLVVIGVLILAGGIFFVSQIDGDNAITGAAIGLNVPENNSNDINLQEDIRIQATCSSWPCSCGDTVNESITMSSSLDCSGSDGLKVSGNNIVIDCAMR